MKRRIIVCLGLIFIVCFVGCVVVLLGLHRSSKDLVRFAESRRFESMRTALVSSAIQLEADLLAHQAGRDRDMERILDNIHTAREAIHGCTDCHHSSPHQEELLALHKTFHGYFKSVPGFMAGEAPNSHAAMEEEIQRITHDIVSKTSKMSAWAEAHSYAGSGDALGQVRRARIVLSATLITVLVVVGIVAFHLMVKLTAPMADLLEGIEKIERGELDYRFSMDADQEFRQLAGALEGACANLADAQEGLIQAEKMAFVGRLSAGVAHEVGNPLASISAITQLMRRSTDSPEQTKHLNSVMEQIGRISRITQGLLTFSRSKVESKVTPVDIGRLLQEAVAMIRYDHRTRSIGISEQFNGGLRPVRGSKDKLLLVFTNVLANAVDAIHSKKAANGGAINITAREVGNHVVVEVEDNGVGIDEDRLPLAFEPFHTTKEPNQGTGLGLWISHQTIQQHNGTIHLESCVGKGTTVTIRIPCAPLSTNHHDDNPPPGPPPPGPVPP